MKIQIRCPSASEWDMSIILQGMPPMNHSDSPIIQCSIRYQVDWVLSFTKQLTDWPVKIGDSIE